MIRSRAQVTTLLKQRRDEREEANKRRSATTKVESTEQKRRMNHRLTEKNRRLSISLCMAKRRHEKDRKRILGEQLNDALKKREAREAHCLCLGSFCKQTTHLVSLIELAVRLGRLDRFFFFFFFF